MIKTKPRLDGDGDKAVEFIAVTDDFRLLCRCTDGTWEYHGVNGLRPDEGLDEIKDMIRSSVRQPMTLTGVRLDVEGLDWLDAQYRPSQVDERGHVVQGAE